MSITCMAWLEKKYSKKYYSSFLCWARASAFQSAIRSGFILMN